MKKENAKMFKIAIIVTILILIILMTTVNILLEKQKNEEKNNSQDIEVQINNSKQIEKTVVINKLAEMEERDRMEYYFSKFINAVESKEYEKAYGMLYTGFKENYFPDLESFETYAKKTFSKFCSVEHTNIERSGENYILYITISDSLSSNPVKKEMTFVIKENDLNDFVMSFSVI